MSLFTLSVEPLPQTVIFAMLKKVRLNAYTPLSHYQVATVVEVKRNENLYFYISGVNIENDEHNRLSMHSEQNALVNTLTLLGGNTQFSNLWVMAAAADAVPDATQKPAKPCGHCRQIMLSLAQPNARIYAVTLADQFSFDSFEQQFLPEAFSEKDLNVPVKNSTLAVSGVDAAQLQMVEILNDSGELPTDTIRRYLQTLSPHIINKEFQTSPITACIVKCHNGRYAMGVLVQDIAFLTTDAVFAVIGNAITQFGSKDLRFDEMHFATNTVHPAQLTFAEIETLSHRYVREDTILHFYTAQEHASYTFKECLQARHAMVGQRLQHPLPHTALPFSLNGSVK